MAGVLYKTIKIVTSEGARWKGAPLYEALVRAVAREKNAARCVVTKGIAGCYEDGEVASHRVLDLSYNMPVVIEVVLPAPEAEVVLARVEAMVYEGIIIVSEADVVVHRSGGALIPRGLLVRDVMTSPAVSVAVDTPLRDVAAVLARSEFDGVPVVDKKGTLVGMVTQNDLVTKGGLQARPEALALLWRGDAGQQVLDSELFASVPGGLVAKDVMAKNAPAIGPDATLADAIRTIAAGDLKRLAVVDKDGRLVGMLARIDILRTASAGSARRRVLESYGVKVPGTTPVGATRLLQVPTVTPDTPALEVLNLLDGEGQRVVVLDERGAPMGVISDRDLLPLLSDKEARRAHELTAASLMRTDIPAVQEDASVEHALSLMVELRRKRLPVVDAGGRYLGMLSREELLRILAPEAEDH